MTRITTSVKRLTEVALKPPASVVRLGLGR